ncbi:MAG: toll/interleukin-1 receptor domain-containing protein [Rhodanobacteraceae bacterium]|nr:toll/interleukin-1 receptor domain-containing protein [Rhodanobacteraceae bacterium]
MSGIFISYRRSDSAGHTGRLADDLGNHLDHQALFRDIEAIEAGVDFVHALEKAVSACTVMLVIIGPNWASAATADGQKRLFQSGDFVRMEIEAALGRDIRVIPVLVGDAQMPGPADIPDSMAALLRRNAYSISDRRWQYDVTQLVDILVKIPGVAGRRNAPAAPPQAMPPLPPPAAPQPAKGGMPGWLKGSIGAVAIIAALALIGLFMERDETGDAPAKPAPVEESATQPKPAADEPAIERAPVDSPFYGIWVSPEGEVFNIDTEDDTGKLYVFAGSRMDDGTGGGTDTPPPDAPGQDLYGNGSISGRRLKATLVDQFSEEKYSVRFELSEDAKTLYGSISKGENGETRELSLQQR